jgi:hypothetical protein
MLSTCAAVAGGAPPSPHVHLRLRYRRPLRPGAAACAARSAPPETTADADADAWQDLRAARQSARASSKPLRRGWAMGCPPAVHRAGAFAAAETVLQSRPPGEGAAVGDSTARELAALAEGAAAAVTAAAAASPGQRPPSRRGGGGAGGHQGRIIAPLETPDDGGGRVGGGGGATRRRDGARSGPLAAALTRGRAAPGPPRPALRLDWEQPRSARRR